MKTSLGQSTIAALLLGFTSSLGFADTTVAYWNFNSFAASDATISADIGNGTIDVSTWGGVLAAISGTTVNALNSDTAGNSLAFQAGTGLPGNDTFITIGFSMTGFQDLSVTFAMRGASNAFASGTWSYSVDGTNFFALPGGVNTTTTSTVFSTVSASSGLIDVLDDAQTAFLRLTLSGASSNAAQLRIDNLQLTATAIPEPATFATLGGAAVLAAAALRRRRRMT